MENRKEFLIKNPTEITTTIVRILGLNVKTLTASIYRDLRKKYRGSNQILRNYKIKAINYFIKFLLIYRISPIHQIIFNTIMSLTYNLINIE